MKNFRKACAVALLVFTLSFTALASDGWIGTGITQPPPPPQSPTAAEPETQDDASDSQSASSEETAALDIVINAALTLFGDFQSLL